MSEVPPPPPAAAPAAPLSPEQDKQWASFAHLGGILWLLPSLIIWLVFKDRGPKTREEGKEALNFQITFLIIYIAIAIVLNIIAAVIAAANPFAALGIVGFFGFIYFLLWVGNIILSILGFVKVNGGGSYRYPFNFRFIK